MDTQNSHICQCIHSYHSNALKHSYNTKGVFITHTFKYPQFYYTPSNKHTIYLHSCICTFTTYHIYYSYELMCTNPPHMHHPHILYILPSTSSRHPPHKHTGQDLASPSERRRALWFWEHFKSWCRGQSWLGDLRLIHQERARQQLGQRAHCLIEHNPSKSPLLSLISDSLSFRSIKSLPREAKRHVGLCGRVVERTKEAVWCHWKQSWV